MLENIKKLDDDLIAGVAKLHRPWLNKVMRFMTFLGDQGKVWFLVMAIILYVRRSIYVGVSFFFSIALTWVMSEVIIKRIVARVRPCNKLDEEKLILKKMPKFYSFPSSHSATSFAMVTISCMLCGTTTTVLILLLAIGISFSRFYLQAHYMTDVVCGIVIGIVVSLIVFQVINLIFRSIDPALIR